MTQDAQSRHTGSVQVQSEGIGHVAYLDERSLQIANFARRKVCWT